MASRTSRVFGALLPPYTCAQRDPLPGQFRLQPLSEAIRAVRYCRASVGTSPASVSSRHSEYRNEKSAPAATSRSGAVVQVSDGEPHIHAYRSVKQRSGQMSTCRKSLVARGVSVTSMHWHAARCALRSEAERSRDDGT